MKIAFYAPLKSPHHPVPSGDRLMARQLLACLGHAGHAVALASELRAFCGDSDDAAAYAALTAQAAAEVERLSALWRAEGAPDLWFCYHPYYKAPDLIGPALCERFGIAYATAEASYSGRRNIGIWADMQARVLDAVRGAAVNIGLTARDRAGLAAATPEAVIAPLKPFIDAAPFTGQTPRPQPGHLVTVAMMRAGDKLESFRALAAALRLVEDRPWRLSVVGDGPLRGEVEALFSGIGDGRIAWLGQKPQAAVAEILAEGALYVWPGCGEAYGLAYLEAQAAGLPVVALRTAGVPEVVEDGKTGRLTAPGDHAAYAAAIAALMDDAAERRRLAHNARARVLAEHSLPAAAAALDAIVRKAVGETG
ncbi:glycosyl transferase [Shinella sp. SUS2]|uniref:glycosyltransferase family 4 protein n=1 Tax=unclassified Shinella TaxID=2643062 RepID=UPI0006819B70|nr:MULTISPECIES: glycosyltransferase family 4 protein [unclassified Shinella]KNY16353.1 glycosyl transferase [Shinella sp. SUS2]KOC75203.1 glycosyl transferase [Shinella sp. GWS1]